LKEVFDEITLDLGRLTNQLQEGTMRSRMIPISQAVHRFPRMVRDLSRQAGKDVAIEIYGAETELDKSVVDIIGEPLIHIIRNAIDHGIEPPKDRQTYGKPSQGKIVLSASHQGNQVVIEIEDDGRGIDLELVKNKAIQQHLITQQEADTLQDKEIADLIFHTGFSTVETVSSLSGRGVGLHVVKRYLEKLNGMIELDTTFGKGSTFTIRLPLTLAIIPALMVGVRTEVFALPLISVEEALRISDQEIRTIESQKVVHLREKMIPLIDLADLLGASIFSPQPSDSPFETVPFDKSQHRTQNETQERDKLFGVIVSDGLREIGLIVDSLVGESDIVIKSLDGDLVNVAGVSGASIQGDGQVALVLDPGSLIELAIKRIRQSRHF
jgi:two-component system chemotaxis sensor kinase CheA